MKRQKDKRANRRKDLKAKKTKSRKDKNTKGQIVIKSKRPPSIRIQAPPALGWQGPAAVGHGDPSELKKEWRCNLKTEKETAAGEEHTELFFFLLSAPRIGLSRHRDREMCKLLFSFQCVPKDKSANKGTEGQVCSFLCSKFWYFLLFGGVCTHIQYHFYLYSVLFE